MYKVSIWLKGGGKIVEDCEISGGKANEIYNSIRTINSEGYLIIPRKDNDEFPIKVRNDQIAAAQIDEKYM